MLRYLNPAYYLQNAQRKGYTIDQTILIVVIIAILITLVIVTVGWNLINRTSGTKLGSQLNQMEDAISQFYSNARVFPHLAFSTAPTAPTTGYALILAGVTPTGATLNSTITGLTNLLPGFTVNGTTSLRNSYGGDIAMINGVPNLWLATTGTAQSMIVQFASVPRTDADEADRSIDGTTLTPTSGRLVMSATSCLPTAGGNVTTPATTTSSTVNVCYVASSL